MLGLYNRQPRRKSPMTLRDKQIRLKFLQKFEEKFKIWNDIFRPKFTYFRFDTADYFAGVMVNLH